MDFNGKINHIFSVCLTPIKVKQLYACLTMHCNGRNVKHKKGLLKQNNKNFKLTWLSFDIIDLVFFQPCINNNVRRVVIWNPFLGDCNLRRHSV